MAKFSGILLLAAALALLGGCGQTGELYLPDPQQEKEKSEQKTDG